MYENENERWILRVKSCTLNSAVNVACSRQLSRIVAFADWLICKQLCRPIQQWVQFKKWIVSTIYVTSTPMTIAKSTALYWEFIAPSLGWHCNAQQLHVCTYIGILDFNTYVWKIIITMIITVMGSSFVRTMYCANRWSLRLCRCYRPCWCAANILTLQTKDICSESEFVCP